MAVAVAKKLGEPDPATLNRRRPVRELLALAFEKHDFTIDRLVKAAKRQLTATKPFVTPDGKVKYVPDGPTRQKAIADGFHVHGAFDAPAENHGHGTIVLHLRPEDRIMIENLRGSPLPPESFIEIVPEESNGNDANNGA